MKLSRDQKDWLIFMIGMLIMWPVFRYRIIPPVVPVGLGDFNLIFWVSAAPFVLGYTWLTKPWRKG